MFAEQFGGEAASYAGLIYAFDPSLHECEPFPIPREWRTVVGYDHGAGGGSDPTAILVASVSPSGHWYFWGELYDEQQRSVKERGQLLRVLLQGRNLACPIMRGRDAKQVGWELQEIGFPSTYAELSSVDARIIKTTALMRDKQFSILRGRCPHLRAQFGSWEWDEKNPGKPRNNQDDHALEAAGYAVLAPLGVLDVMPSADPDRVEGESREVAEHWKPMREKLRLQEESRRQNYYDRLLDEEVFAEESAQFIG
jgi:hypothetical protein